MKNIYIILDNQVNSQANLLVESCSQLEFDKKLTSVSECADNYKNAQSDLSISNNLTHAKHIHFSQTYLMNGSLKDMQAEMFSFIEESPYPNHVFVMSPGVSKAFMDDDGDFIHAMLDHRIVVLNVLNSYEHSQSEIRAFKSQSLSQWINESYHFVYGTVTQAKNHPANSNFIVIPQLAQNVIDELDKNKDYLLFDEIDQINHFQNVQLGTHLDYLDGQGFRKIFSGDNVKGNRGCPR